MSVLIFIIVQLINVISGTIKYIVTIKSKPLFAGIINALSYTLSAWIVKLITEQDLWIVLAVTFITNAVGVPLGKIIVDVLRKDSLWIYHVTLKCSLEEAKELKNYFKYCEGIKSTYIEVAKDEMYDMRFFSRSKNESRKILDVIKAYDNKYFITESR